ncbi:MAG: hypothetical protein QNJ49_02150 [Mastigocoleus sp. MO_167.B18]|nr:hypothetical protein [Mastigocoleus sp. MO_167.B18]
MINTEQIKSQSTKDIRHRLPWREWDYFPGNSSLEVALYLHQSQLKFKQIEKVKSIKNEVFRRVKITSIFGDNQNIDIETEASSSRDHTVKLWQTNTGKLIRTLEGHQDSVDGVSFSKRRSISKRYRSIARYIGRYQWGNWWFHSCARF